MQGRTLLITELIQASFTDHHSQAMALAGSPASGSRHLVGSRSYSDLLDRRDQLGAEPFLRNGQHCWLDTLWIPNDCCQW